MNGLIAVCWIAIGILSTMGFFTYLWEERHALKHKTYFRIIYKNTNTKIATAILLGLTGPIFPAFLLLRLLWKALLGVFEMINDVLSMLKKDKPEDIKERLENE